MKVHFLGAARTTTGSMYLVEVNGRKFLLECGLHQGRRDESTERNRTFPFDPRELDAVVLSHAHIDHCGNLPNLVKQGFDGNIYCTHATRDLAVIMLADSAKIQQSDSEFVSRQRARRGEPPVLPLYSPADAEKTTRLFVAVGHGRPLPVTDGGSYSVLPCVSPADGSDGSDGSHGGRARKGLTGRDSTGLCRQDAGSTLRRFIPTLGGYR